MWSGWSDRGSPTRHRSSTISAWPGWTALNCSKRSEPRFDIDLSRVDWVRYFGEERRYNPFRHLWCMLGGRRLDEGIVPLRVSDLKRSVAERRWCEPSREETG